MSSPIIRSSSSELAIVKPTPGQMLLPLNPSAGNGQVMVHINKLGSYSKFVGRIYDATVPPANRTLPASAAAVTAPNFELTFASGNTYKNDAAPTTIPAAIPNLNNKVVVVGAYDGSNNLVNGSQASVGFMLMPPVADVEVSAKCCIWLTFAPPGTTLAPYGERLPEFRPVSIEVPENATQANLVVQSGRWRHDPADSTESDAGGRSQTMPLQRPDIYRDPDVLNAKNIMGHNVNIRLNKLIGLWDYGWENESTIIEVGASATLAVPGSPRPTRLHLAFHDGYEWSNNSGSVTVRVTWT